MRPRGKPQSLEDRRLMAMALLAEDLSISQVAARLGVTNRAVQQWQAAYREQGPAGLKAKPNLGRPANWQRHLPSLEQPLFMRLTDKRG